MLFSPVMVAEYERLSGSGFEDLREGEGLGEPKFSGELFELGDSETFPVREGIELLELNDRLSLEKDCVSDGRVLDSCG